MDAYIGAYAGMANHSTAHGYDYYGAHYGDYGHYIYDTYLYEGREHAEHIGYGFFTVGIIITLVNTILLLTAFSPSARAKAASWYMYHIIIITLLEWVVIKPPMIIISHKNVLEEFLVFCERVLGLIQSQTIVLMNFEIILGILAPKECWCRRQGLRFYISLFAQWIFSIVLFGILCSISAYNNHFGEFSPFYLDMAEEIVYQTTKNWFPAAILIGTSITATVSYIRGCTNGVQTYNNISDISGDVVNPRDWFICLIIVNALFITIDVFLYMLHNEFIVQGLYVDLIVSGLIGIARCGMPLAFLSVSAVRKTIYTAMCTICYKFKIAELYYRGMRSRTGNGQDTDNVMNETDTLNDESL